MFGFDLSGLVVRSIWLIMVSVWSLVGYLRVLFSLLTLSSLLSELADFGC